ncbi:unnamed protein product [Ambrosiozyma monospora]|uniref:Unnamed protein product n=1 Tax=Ambrosiozyma monospora TaxID=43982 RepID=A0ACB5TDN2_AMBMO|nr:unnamed protein product [Ambrosiozyma monospora]
MNATKLDSVAFRVGLLATLRSIKLQNQTIGVMITASHNPPEDNGVKIVEPMGEMLPQAWEPLATKLANVNSFDEFIEVLKEIVESEKIDLSANKGNVILARDTRESGPALLSAAIDGVLSLGGSYKDEGELTTPQLHYLTRSSNDKSFGQATEAGYYTKLVKTIEEILKIWSIEKPLEITVDGANGVGAAKLENIKSSKIQVTVINDQCDQPHMLNVDCGADYVKTNQKLPAGISGNPVPLKLYSSFDGDADRVVLYYVDKDLKFKLLDGDKIATLLAGFISGLLNQLKGDVDLKLGIVQTAYANGSSTKFIESTLNVPVAFTSTGVKHLHHKAQEYDIGVYFEANGHGTVLFSENYITTLKNYKSLNDEETKVQKTLLLLVDLINQTVGDSISDLFAVLIALAVSKKTPTDWDSQYLDLPNKLTKLIVNDRFAFKTTNAERQLLQPVGLQEKIDETVAKFKNGRSFVRASGTENAVRVYAEADTKENCELLNSEVSEWVKKFS